MASFEDRIRDIVTDREHGSSTLVQLIIDELSGGNDSFPTTVQQRWALRELRRIDRSMVVVHHLLDTLGTEPGNNLPERVRQYAQQWSDLPVRVIGHLLSCRDWDNAHILLHSHSGLLVSAATEAHRTVPGIRFWQTRSEPGGEGVSQYHQLRQRGVACTLLADDEAVNGSHAFDAAWLGVDQYDAQWFVNKVGSRRVTRTLTDTGGAVYVLGDSRKRVDRLDYSEELFETVPFADGVWLVTERGLSPVEGN